MNPRLRGDRGSVTTEMVIVAPIAIVLICFITLVGRVSSARDQVDSAARDAARAASLERSATAANTTATQTATTSLAAGGFHCASVDVTTDVSSYGPGGQVAVTVTCNINLSDLGLLGLGGTRPITTRAVEVIDTYKAVS